MPGSCPPLSTEHYSLDPLTAEYGPLIFNLRTNEQVQQYISRPLMKDRAESAYFIREITAGIQTGQYKYWVITSRSSRQPIGTVCLWQFDQERTQAFVGYEILPDAQGQGVMTEVLSRIIAYARDTLNLQRLHASTHRDNTPSTRLLASAGFIYREEAEEEEGHHLFTKYLTGLPAYLQRIGLSPLARPGLQELQQAHLYSVPFENLDIHLGRSISILHEDVFEKIVHRRRGGFCYEQNSLFRWALLELGFRAHLIQAQVWSARKKEYGPPFDHMAVWVEMDEGPYLADVGYGNAPLVPMPVRHGASAEGTNGQYRMEAIRPGSYQLNHRSDEEWVPDYIFGLHARAIEEYEPMALYHQTAAESPFPQKQIISLPKRDGGRVSISGDELKITDADGSQQMETLLSEQAFDRALERYFGVRINR